MIARALLLLMAALFAVPAAETRAADEIEAVPGTEQLRQILVVTRLPPVHFRPGSQYGGAYSRRQSRSAVRLADRIAREAELAVVDDWPLPLLELNCFVMAVPEGRSVDEVIEAVSRDPDVVFAEPMHLYETQASPASYDDPMYPAQPLGSGWQLAVLHRVSTGRRIKVAVIDSGVERLHPDLSGRVVSNMNFVEGRPFIAELHGTAVAGVIAANANNGAGIVGVAPDAQLMALRACWQRQGAGPAVCDTLSLAKALHFAIERGAMVINMSLAGPRAEVLDRLLDQAIARRISVVAAYDQALPGGGFPASKPGVIAVADDTLARPLRGVYTAPGHDVITSEPGGKWGMVNGSSYSAAHVSGLYALLRAGLPAKQEPPALVTSDAGGGAIDACASLRGTARKARLACGAWAPVVRAGR